MLGFDVNAMVGLAAAGPLLAAGPGAAANSTFIAAAIFVILVLIVLIHLFVAAPRAGGVENLLRGYGSDITRFSLARTWAVSSVCFADSIVVLGDRGIVEQGTHEELLARDGQYAGLWRLQTGT